MQIILFIVSNWDSVLVVVAVFAGIGILVVKKQYAILDTMIFSLVTEAEKKYGSGTGIAKLADVIERVYPKISAIIRLFITAKRLEKLIERVLIDAKERWKSPELAAYIAGERK